MGEAALTPSDSASSSSPGIGRLTPESSDGEFFSEVRDRDGDEVVADPLLGGHDDEVYELSEGGGGGAAEKSHDDGFTYTAEEERAVVRKLDRRLVLFVALLYTLSFLDRSSPSHTPAALFPSRTSSFPRLYLKSDDFFYEPVPGSCISAHQSVTEAWDADGRHGATFAALILRGVQRLTSKYRHWQRLRRRYGRRPHGGYQGWWY